MKKCKSCGSEIIEYCSTCEYIHYMTASALQDAFYN